MKNPEIFAACSLEVVVVSQALYEEFCGNGPNREFFAKATTDSTYKNFQVSNFSTRMLLLLLVRRRVRKPVSSLNSSLKKC